MNALGDHHYQVKHSICPIVWFMIILIPAKEKYPSLIVCILFVLLDCSHIRGELHHDQYQAAEEPTLPVYCICVRIVSIQT